MNYGSGDLAGSVGIAPLVSSTIGRARVPRKTNERLCGYSFIGSDLISLAVAQATAAILGALIDGPSFALQQSGMSWYTLVGQQVFITVGLAIAVLVYLGSRNHYSEKLPFWSEARQVVIAGMLALPAAGLLETSIHSNISRSVLLGTWFLFPITAIGFRSLARQALHRAGLWQLPILVIGDEADQATVAEVIGSESIPGYQIIRAITPDIAERWAVEGWHGHLERDGARRIAIAAGLRSELDGRIIQSIVRQQIPFFIIPKISALPVVGCYVVPFFSHDTVMLSYRNNLAQPILRLTKASFDVAAAALLLLVLLPVMLAIAVAIRFDGGPAFFSHGRVGADGKVFNCLKFRTMVVDSQERLARCLASDPAKAAEWAETQKLRDDPRITRIGRVLRSTSLDELPQLLNILRLEMSLVGPRPITREEVSRYSDDIAFYYETRPGLTGLWQVSGRSETSFAERVRLDTWYVKNWTIWHDIAILAKTVLVVLARRGAH